VKVTSYLHVVGRLRMHGAMHRFSHTPSWRSVLVVKLNPVRVSYEWRILKLRFYIEVFQTQYLSGEDKVQGGWNMTGLFVCKQVTVCPGHIWTTLYHMF
jgi:hypothetical protein